MTSPDAVVGSSIPTVLEARANLQPSDPAFTYIDYQQDWAGVEESLTWSQLYRRTSNVAQELKACGSTGDRAVVLAPQGLDYVIAFLGALQAGWIAVPLSEPLGGASDERVSAVLRDASPSAILTTSSVAGNIAEHIQLKPGESAPSIIELDLLDLDSQNGPAAEPDQIGQTLRICNTPPGRPVHQRESMISHKNMVANVRAGGVRVLRRQRGCCSTRHDYGVLASVFSRHGFGISESSRPCCGESHAVVTSPVAFLQRPARWMQLLASNSHAFTAAPNVAFELATRKTSDDDMAGLDLGGRAQHSQWCRARTTRDAPALRRAVRSLQSSAQGVAALVWARGSHGVSWRPANRVNHQKPFISNPRN